MCRARERAVRHHDVVPDGEITGRPPKDLAATCGWHAIQDQADGPPGAWAAFQTARRGGVVACIRSSLLAAVNRPQENPGAGDVAEVARANGSAAR